MGTSIRLTAAVALALAASLIALVGCTVSIDEAPPGSEPTASQSPAAPQGASADGSASAPSQPDPDVAANAAAWREALAPSITQSQTCQGTLEIGETGVGVQVSGDCERLVVSGTSAVVLAESVTELEVSGTGALVILDGVAQLSISGTSARAYWTDTSTPTVLDTATGSSYGPLPPFDPQEMP